MFVMHRYDYDTEYRPKEASHMISQRSASAMCLIILSLMVFGCSPGPPPAPETPVSKESLQQKVDRLQLELFRLRLKVNGLTDGTAYVGTEDKGYSVAQTKYGSFAVLCRNLSPYLDGYKAQLAIGNLTSARFDGAKISLQWGEDFSKSKETSVTNNFLPGTYTNLEVVMTPAKPEDVKNFLITLEFNQIGLY